METEQQEVKVDVSKNVRFFMIGIGIAIGVALVCAVFFGIYRAYKIGASDTFTYTVAKILRLPAMKINGTRVLYTDYVKDLRAINQMIEYDKQNNGGSASMTDEGAKLQVLMRLANNVLVLQQARTYEVKVEEQDIKNAHDEILGNFGSEEQLSKELMARYGWTMADYDENVIKYFVLQSKLNEAIEADVNLREVSRNLAVKVLSEIKNGASFEEKAKEYGQDGTAANGGDLGWFGKGDMVPEFENAVVALKPGELVKDLVETQFGWHIIRLDEKKMEKEKNDAGKMVNVEKYKARHILFSSPSYANFMDKAARDAEVHLYIKAVKNPFEKDAE